MSYFFVFTLAFIIVYLITPTIRFVALKFYAIDKRSKRKIHSKVITKLGGLAIFLGFLGGLAVVPIFATSFFKVHAYPFIGLVLCSGLMLLLGMYDDFQNSGPVIKLFVQAVIAILLAQVGFRIERIWIPGIFDIKLGALSGVFTVFWLLGTTNAANLIDGLDGLAAGIIVIASFFFCLYGIALKEQFTIFVGLALMGANLAFLRYNSYPAKIFMGDTGSLFLGLNIGALGAYPHYYNGGYNSVLVVPALLLFALPVIDIIYAIVRRGMRRKHLFVGDNAHIHHQYIKQGFTQVEAVRRFYVMTFSLGVVSLLLIFRYAGF